MRASQYSSVGRALGALGLAAVFLALLAATAKAAPNLSLELERDQESVSRGDERIEYAVKVKNTASANPVAGDQLFCNGIETAPGVPKNWFPGAPGDPTHPSYSFEWRRNGVAIPSANAQAYTTTAADEGAVIQCLVTGTNAAAAAVFSSVPAAVVSPLPATPPPASSGPTENGSRPTVTDEGGTGRTGLEKGICVPSANWTGGPTYTFQWLLNGASIPGATSNEYTPVAADEGKVLQCQVTGTNAGGSLVGISNISPINVAGVPTAAAAQNPAVEFANSTSGTVTLTVELPGGQETFVLGTSGAGWSCASTPPAGAEPAKAVCTRADALAPGASYPTLSVSAALGSDAPDLAIAKATVSGGGTPAPVSAVDEFVFGPPIPFGITAFQTLVADAEGNDYTQAGGHPFSAGLSFSLSRRRNLVLPTTTAKFFPTELVKTIDTEIPPGFIGNPEAVPQLCPDVGATLTNPTTCPLGSVVGGITLLTSGLTITNAAIYAMEPERGVPARFVFVNLFNKGVYSLTPRLRPEDGYAITIESAPVTQTAPLLDVEHATLCGFGAKTSVSSLGTIFAGCKEKDELGANPKPFLTNQTACSPTPPVTRLRVDSWEDPGDVKSAEAAAPLVTGCENVPFSPTIDLRPSSSQADSPTGLDVSITVSSEGLEDPDGISQAHLKRATVTLPAGMSVNPAAADGLGACGADQIRLGTDDPVQCPPSSRIGSATVETPLLEETLEGAVYLAKQGDNPFRSLLALYLVAESKERGILVKIPGRVTPHPVTGQLVSTFDDNPQVPFSSLKLHFNAGDRAPLLNPPACGSFEIRSELTPWSAKDPDNPSAAEASVQTSTFAVDSGPGGGPCPTGALEPKLRAGVANPVAGSSSPFLMSLRREDGTQRFSGLDLTLPPGLTADLQGVPYCPDAVLAAIPAGEGTGAGELAVSSCPAASRIGTASAGAGAGANPFYVHTGRVYLAGPYKGAPLSLAVVVPAVAGPFDLGNVAVRTALHVDPRTAQITAISDPLPTVLHGIPLDVRDVRVSVDRENFTQAPTSCEEMSVLARVTGASGGSATASDRFQVGECAALGFAPRLKLRLKGGTRRAANPKLIADLRARPGDANVRRAQVTLPRSAFLDQSHIGTVCTRVQFAADQCPAGAVYGRAMATSPLLDYPISGLVYLRSSSNPLPDLVADLRGPAYQPIQIELVGRVSSARRALRNTFDVVPDAPVTKFRLELFGGKRGLIVNSRDICKHTYRATAKFDGQNGRVHDIRPKVANDCGR